MGADREGGARRTPRRAVAYAACGVVLLSGCASMPDDGELRGVDYTPRQDSQVRVFAVPPGDGAAPQDIVDGFLEALTSDDPHFETAKLYLTPEAAKSWDPEGSTTVLANGMKTDVDAAQNRDNASSYSVTLSGTQVGALDAQRSYRPAEGGYRQQIQLERNKKNGQWRITRPPQGVVIGQSDFQRNYMSANKYYFASNGIAGSPSRPMAVADPVYVRERVDPMTQMVRSVLEGPTVWLDQVVRTSFPTGVKLKDGVETLAPDEQNILTVPLNDSAARVGPAKCREMATQLLFTLQNLTSAVDQVELRAGGRQLCLLDEDVADTVAARGATERPGYLYFLDGRHRLVRMPARSEDKKALAVPGQFGEGLKELRSAAVSRREDRAAGVSLDGRRLYVGQLASDGTLGQPLLVSQGRTETDRLTAPSWDPAGNLWVADRDLRRPRLLMFDDAKGTPLEVETPGLDGRIDSVRVAGDGVRIALVVEKDGRQSLLVGRIERGDKPADPDERARVSVLELRSATPVLEEVTAMSWVGESRLVVVGTEQGGVQQMQYVQVDGSTPEAPVPAALTGVEEIAGTEDGGAPLVAHSEDGIVRMPTGEQWQKVVTEGSAPVYPG
ncbi:LpqB family beta-propeller domain-containing protein [Streptomyces sp. enrichment culture]|uniref:LpqB family beta-propeller domain-containing protein n=1 Tax=Streptomyces sp. enrichment culture TaxID=1795815 RepID=UPI003F579814